MNTVIIKYDYSHEVKIKSALIDQQEIKEVDNCLAVWESQNLNTIQEPGIFQVAASHNWIVEADWVLNWILSTLFSLL